ncbi:MAG: hypothetical protein ACQERN_14850 [Thermodesulfobacteriota bacterium]
MDISSGVEASPGQKDYNKVQTFVHTVRTHTPNRSPRRIF